MPILPHANFLFKHLYPSPSMVLFSLIHTEGEILFPLNFCFAKLNKPRVSAAKPASHSSGQPFFFCCSSFWMNATKIAIMLGKPVINYS